MGNMLTYIERYGDQGFDRLPFCEVDSLILAQAAYFVLDGYVSARHRFNVTLREIANLPDKRITQDTTLPKENKLLLEAIGKSRRFGDVLLACYRSVTDTETELQFSAVTMRLAPRLHYIAFRGTDISIVGWKEDFNLSFSKNIPAQIAAAQYLKKTARYLRGHLILGGHSKGGNLAVYAAMHAPHGIKKRITAIYNHDGPGFVPEVFASEAYKSVQDRIFKTVPHCALVGLLFSNHSAYTVVASKTFPLLQHNPFTWEIEGRDFVRLKKVDMFSRLANETMDAWMLELSNEERKAFIDALFDLLNATNAETYPELVASLKANISPLRDKIKALDPKTRTMIHKTFRALIKVGAQQMKLLIQKGKKY